jgi:glutamate synthase (NADPH) large chain
VVVLGPTGRNFAAGMSGGVAYVYDPDDDFEHFRCNVEMVDLEALEHPEDIAELRRMIERHWKTTDSSVARRILDNFTDSLTRFIKVMPVDYKNALARLAPEKAKEEADITA